MPGWFGARRIRETLSTQISRCQPATCRLISEVSAHQFYLIILDKFVSISILLRWPQPKLKPSQWPITLKLLRKYLKPRIFALTEINVIKYCFETFLRKLAGVAWLRETGRGGGWQCIVKNAGFHFLLLFLHFFSLEIISNPGFFVTVKF